MRNTIAISIYIPFLLLSMVIFLLEITNAVKKRRHIPFTLMCVCSIASFICEINSYFTDAGTPAVVLNIGLMFIGFMPPLMFLSMHEFYRPSVSLGPKRVAALLALPTANAIICLSSNYHTILRAVTVISTHPVRNHMSQWGPWFWFHTACSYLITIMIIILIVYEHLQMPRYYRLATGLMTVSIGLVLFGNLITLLSLLPSNIDITAITTSLAILFIHLALRENERSPLIRYARTQVFSFMSEFILILGENGLIADYNPSAEAWFSSAGIPIHACSIQDVLGSFTQKGATTVGKAEDGAGMNIHLTNGSFQVVLNLKMHEMMNRRGSKIGTIAIFSDVTENHKLIEKLEAKAGIDPITGIANRIACEGAKKRLDVKGRLPLSIIMCDMNGLKYVNDSLGHQYGDRMLSRTAELLEKNCPKEGFVARIGGDEFIFLLPKTKAAEAGALMLRIERAFADCWDLPFPMSIALGAATKYNEEENLEDVIALADRRMYRNKYAMKA